MYLINKSLKAYSTKDLLKKRSKLFEHKYYHPQIEEKWVGSDQELAVSPDGKLEPGKLYPSSKEPELVQYYLPKYRLNMANGQFTTSLKWQHSQDSSNSSLGLLTIDLLPQIPHAERKFKLREIDHVAAVRIGYNMPIRGTKKDLSDINSWLGNWVNVDVNTRGMTRLKVAKTSDQKITLQGFGKCHPTDCDWGVTPAQLTAGTLKGTYDFGWKKTHITLSQQDGQLIADVFSDYSEKNGRTDRKNRYILRLETPINQGPRLWFEVGALERLPSGVRQCRRRIESKEEFDRLYQVMTDPQFNAQLEIQSLATIGHRSWRQIVLDQTGPTAQITLLKTNKALFTNTVDFTALKPLASTVQQPSVKQFKTVQVAPQTVPIKPVQQQIPLQAMNLSPQLSVTQIKSSQRQASVPSQPGVKPSSSKPLELTEAQLKAIAVQPQIARVFAQPINKSLQESDLTINVNGQQKAAIPTKAVVSAQGQPAILQIPAETKQLLGFVFSPDTHGYMFDRPSGEAPAELVLIKRSVHSQAGTVIGTVWQDLSLPDQFYYEPEEFRLGRRSQPTSDAPYQPDLVIALYEAAVEGESNATTISYRAELAYQAQPYINPKVLELASEQLAEPQMRPKFTALSPVESQLTLQLPLDQSNGQLTAVDRPEVDVSFDDGIIDEVPLSQSELERILAAFRSPVGVGVSGQVRVRLLDGTQAQIPVNLSLLETASPLFDTTFHGPVAGEAGRYRFSLRNRIESPVQVDGIEAIALAPDITAYPQTAAGFRVEPAASVTLDYLVTPADAHVRPFAPILSTRILVQTQDSEMWETFIVSEGYTAETFRVNVSIAPIYFESTPPGMTPLTGVHVEFDSGAAITLTPASLSQEVELRMPLLPRLMNDVDAKQYRYQITNIHGEELGAETDWLFSDQGELPLVIEPAQ
jgi:hypothetical protein